MITEIIVFASLILAALYTLIWLLRKDLRQQIEQPKHRFQQQVSQYDVHFLELESEGK